MNINNNARPASPCISLCTLDDDNVCLGCGRTLDEVGRWSTMTAKEQWAVVDRLRSSSATYRQQG